jgi:hypothetical protein
VNQLWLSLADWFLVVFHSLFIMVVVFGWIHPKTLSLQLTAAGLTLFSWVGLGFFFGFGYCPLTDLHWWILDQLGTPDLPRSYTQYLVQKLLGIPVSVFIVDTATVIGLGIGLVGGFYKLVQIHRKTNKRKQ